MSDTTLLSTIEDYYEARKLKRPDSTEAVLWAITELGEVCEQLLAKRGGWVRNNPTDHPPFTLNRFGEELGDVVMMLFVAGWAEGIDVELDLLAKMERKLSGLH